MAATDLAILCAYYVFAIFGPIIFRRRGSPSPLRFTPGRGAVIWVGFVVANGVLLSAPMLALTRQRGASPLFSDGPWRYLGCALGVAAVLVIVLSRRTMRGSWRVGVDESEHTELVTEGPFAVTRNPIYSALVLLAAATVLMVANLSSIIALVMFIILIEAQTRLVEEPYLVRSHGHAYRRYAGAVGRFVPFIGRLRDTHVDD